jgi:hypothetical protein
MPNDGLRADYPKQGNGGDFTRRTLMSAIESGQASVCGAQATVSKKMRKKYTDAHRDP